MKVFAALAEKGYRPMTRPDLMDGQRLSNQLAVEIQRNITPKFVEKVNNELHHGHYEGRLEKLEEDLRRLLRAPRIV